jgi:hypothetical protein
MKTKEISFDVISQVKRNNKLACHLSDIEKIVDDMYWNYPENCKLNIDQVKKDIKDYTNNTDLDDFTPENFLYLILKFIEVNQNILIENSKNLVKI